MKNEPKTADIKPAAEPVIVSNGSVRTDAVGDLIDEAEEIKRMLRDSRSRALIDKTATLLAEACREVNGTTDFTAR